MKIWIPTLGSRLRLDQDWTFNLVHDSRNVTLASAVVGKKVRNGYHWGPHIINFWCETDKYPSDASAIEPQLQLALAKVTLPAGTILEVDRVYIKQGQSYYDSVTFIIDSHPTFPKKPRIRFYASLTDVNTIWGTPL